jgi:hypothetical protein
VFTLVNTVCNTYDSGALFDRGQICVHSGVVGWALSLGTNVTCTALVWFKAWYTKTLIWNAAADHMSDQAASQDDARVEFVWESLHNVNRKNPLNTH